MAEKTLEEELSAQLDAADAAEVTDTENTDTVDSGQETETAGENQEGSENAVQQGEEAEGTESQETASGDEVASGDDESDEGEIETVSYEAPEHWSDDDKKEFLAIQEAQDAQTMQERAYNFIERRYKEMQTGVDTKFKENAHNTRLADTLHEVFQPFKSELDMAGVDEVTAVRQMAATHGMLKSDPVGALVKVVQQYQIDPKAAIQTLSQTAGIDLLDIEAGAQVDPVIVNMQQELADAKATIQQLQAAPATEAATQIQQQMQTFAGEKDTEGNILHPHFDRLLPEMTNLVKSGLASNIEDAYDKALKLNPAEETKPLFTKTVTRAKAAATTVDSSSQGDKAKPATLEEELDSQLTAAGYK